MNTIPTQNFLIWNGCDGYKVAEEGEELFTRSQRYEAFPVGEEITLADVPLDDDGEPDFTGIIITECGKIFRDNQA